MMGNLFSRSRSPATELERVALTIDDLKQKLLTISSRNSTTLYYYYMGVLIALSIAMAHTWLRFEDPTKTYVAVALVFGAAAVVLVGRYVINAFFSWRTNRTTQQLEYTISQKTTLLDLVKETLKFKEAKEILDRYEKADVEKPVEKMATAPQPIEMPKKTETAGTPKIESKSVANTPSTPGPRPGADLNMVNMTPYHQRNPNVVPIRPFLRQTTALDRVLDYFMSDGPNCRNALICSICQTHNGMALPAEYPYISFRCFECGHLNPAKKMGSQGPLTRPPVGPKGIQHSGRVEATQPHNGNNFNRNPSPSESQKSFGNNPGEADAEKTPEQKTNDEAGE